MKRKILSIALCLSMIISMVVFAPISFAVADGEFMATTEQTTLDATEDNTGDIAAPGDQETTPVPEEDAVTPAEDQDADSAAAEPQPGVTDANDSIKDTETKEPAQDADNSKGELPPAVNFTDAGPLLPAVNVATIVKKAAKKVSGAGERALTGEKDSTPEGLHLDKTATPNGDGTYKITLDAYTTGNVTTTTTTTPVDIVLVLDQSGSMTEKMKDGTTRQKALKQAVNGFIDGVSEKYSTEADHRIAIVDFRSDYYNEYPYNAKVVVDWTDVNDAGATSMKKTVNSMKAKGGTRTDAGMAEAVNLMTKGKGYYYNGSNKNRQKVVIVFTDGDPNGIDQIDGFEMKVANAAIANAKTLKDAGCTVYSVGIFDGANPNELYGGSGPNEQWKKSKTKKSLLANRFMNYMSSNYKSASSMHLEEKWISTGFISGYDVYVPVNPPAKTGSNYYLTASDSASLNSIFQKIVNNIGTPTIELGKDTVVKDIISNYFELPKGANADSIKLYTEDATATGLFTNKKEAPADVKATISDDGKTVSVTGFDFNANFVSEKAKADGTYGKKLIIEFDVKVRDGFMGGNNVPTNGTASGIYKNASDNTPVGTFEVPEVDIDLPEISVTAPNKNVYLFSKLEEKDFADAKKVTINGKEYTQEQFDALGWENDFVDLNFDNVVSGNEFDKLANDTNYTVKATLSPKTSGTKTAKTDTATAKINVFKPELTYRDVTKYYGEAADNTAILRAATVGNIAWKHNDTVAEPAKMTGTAPTVESTAAIANKDDINENGVFNTAEDSYYKVTSKINGEDIANHVTYKHEACTPNCGFNSDKGQFIVHKKTCTLNVIKTLQSGDRTDSFVMKVTGNTKADFEPFEVLVTGTEHATVKGLPVGTYTVTEDTNWSWRYEAVDGASKTATLEAGKDNAEVTITNRLKENKWLNFVTSVQNLFTKAN